MPGGGGGPPGNGGGCGASSCGGGATGVALTVVTPLPPTTGAFGFAAGSTACAALVQFSITETQPCGSIF